MVLESKLQTDISMEEFGEGRAIAEQALGKDFQWPASALRPKPLVAGGATSIYGAFAPELSGEYSLMFDVCLGTVQLT